MQNCRNVIIITQLQNQFYKQIKNYLDVRLLSNNMKINIYNTYQIWDQVMKNTCLTSKFQSAVDSLANLLWLQLSIILQPAKKKLIKPWITYLAMSMMTTVIKYNSSFYCQYSKIVYCSKRAKCFKFNITSNSPKFKIWHLLMIACVLNKLWC